MGQSQYVSGAGRGQGSAAGLLQTRPSFCVSQQFRLLAVHRRLTAQTTFRRRNLNKSGEGEHALDGGVIKSHANVSVHLNKTLTSRVNVRVWQQPLLTVTARCCCMIFAVVSRRRLLLHQSGSDGGQPAGERYNHKYPVKFQPRCHPRLAQDPGVTVYWPSLYVCLHQRRGRSPSSSTHLPLVQEVNSYLQKL